MPFVKTKAEDWQTVLPIHRSRDSTGRQLRQMANMIRCFLRELGHILPLDITAVTAFAKRYTDGD